MSAGKKRVFIKTYGCQMNVYDSARMTDALAPAGYVPAEDAESADLILLNTCHIREKAAEKVYSELGRLRALKEAGAAEVAVPILDRDDNLVAGLSVAGASAEIEHRFDDMLQELRDAAERILPSGAPSGPAAVQGGIDE